MAKIEWKIRGTLKVEDFLIPNTTVDVDAPNGSATASRVLAGVKVKVKAALRQNGPYASWGTDITSPEGYFEITKDKSDKPRKIRILIELNDSDLSVREKNRYETLGIYEGRHSGPTVDLGEYVLAGGSGGTVQISTQWKALTWYVCKCVIDTLREQGSRIAFKRKFRVHVPTWTLSGISWARGLGRDNVYVVQDAFNLVTIIHEIMHIWNYQHNDGLSNWLAAVWGDSDTAGDQENPNIAFHEGFAEYAAWELMHLIWGLPKALPYPRNWHTTRGYTSLARIEKNWHGVKSCLRMMTAANPSELDVGVAGDGMLSYASVTGPTTGCPSGQLVSFFDLLRVFSPGRGWKKEWQVGNKSYGVRRFFRRASDILDSFSDGASQLMLDVIDPSGTVQSQERCDELAEDIDPHARRRMRVRKTTKRPRIRRTRGRGAVKQTPAEWRHAKAKPSARRTSKKSTRKRTSTKKKTSRR